MKIWMRRVVSIVLIVVLLLLVQRLVEPKYAVELFEGNFTAEYYKEKMNHQVLMVGDCELYENFDPITLWDEYGITTYIRGNAQQLSWHSYYLLKEALKKETPEVVVFNVLELKYNEPQKEEYNRLALDRMKWSVDKLKAIQASMTEEEEFMDYLFPILRYHSRITQLTEEDFSYYTSVPNHTISGYYMRIDESPYIVGEWGDENDVGKYTREHQNDSLEEEWDDGEWLEDSEEEEEWDDGEWIEDPDEAEEIEPLGDHAMHYLDLIRELCEEKGISLLLVKAPSVSPAWYDEWEEQILDYAQTYQLNYINYLDLVDQIGIDFATDTYDEGLHMNYSGAVKCARHLGGYLKEHYPLKDNRSDAAISAVWEQKKAQQQELIQAQQKELEEFGEIINY